jgi:hypothetical protein
MERLRNNLTSFCAFSISRGWRRGLEGGSLLPGPRCTRYGDFVGFGYQDTCAVTLFGFQGFVDDFGFHAGEQTRRLKSGICAVCFFFFFFFFF